ncbi:hypothetical protein EIP91_002684 [Steccherinum ochraceum]|uniref:Uncharacterized protein n=1 Tax=Steccherinum ochraceum TaxID=92696 RepID=A0A4R0RNJ2_9APHY|nr:hypothetical protein EIP91_002684 [Steccherinum ochraceum]
MSTPSSKRPQHNVLNDNVQKRSMWQSFSVLPAQTRLKISLAVTAFAVAGIYISDQLEAAIPAPPPQRTEKRQP